MVAIATPTTTTPGRVRRHPLPSGGPGRAVRPGLRLVPPRARTVAGRPVGAVVATALLVLAVALAGASLARTPAPTPGAGGAATTHVVAEGETLWSIAVAHAPAGEAATYVERLADANGTARVAPGQTITLPRP